MDNTNQAPTAGVGVRREPSTDPVKAQGILASVTKKEKHAARLWQQRWGFLSRVREIQEEEAQRLGKKYTFFKTTEEWLINSEPKLFISDYYPFQVHIGMKFDEYRAAVQSVSCKPEKELSVDIDPSPTPLPSTSSGIIGRRARCTLERFGPTVKTTRDYPIQPPLSPGQIYNPFKQTIMFLGSVEGDPISYKLAPARCEVTDDMWAQPQKLDVMLFDFDKLNDA